MTSADSSLANESRSGSGPTGADGTQAFADALRAYLEGTLSLSNVRRELAACLYQSLEPAGRVGELLEEAEQDGRILPYALRVLAADLRQITTEETPTDASSGASSPGQPASPEPPRQSAGPRSGAEISTGTILRERYLLEDRMPAGGMSYVFRAIDRRRDEAGSSDPAVAIKVLNPELRNSAAARRRLQQEALIGQRLAHPNIVRIFDFDRWGSEYFIVMEWLRGESLATRLDRIGSHPLPFAEAGRIVAGIASALQHAHARGIVHGDLKPANVFLTDGDEIKLLDFGLATDIESAPEESIAVSHDYASCEVLAGAQPTAADDVYALACLIYRMLTGYRPFGSRGALQAEANTARAKRPKMLNRRQWGSLRQGLAWRRPQRQTSVPTLIDGIWSDDARRTRWPVRSTIVLALIAAGLASWWFGVPDWTALMARFDLRPPFAGEPAGTQGQPESLPEIPAALMLPDVPAVDTPAAPLAPPVQQPAGIAEPELDAEAGVELAPQARLSRPPPTAAPPPPAVADATMALPSAGTPQARPASPAGTVLGFERSRYEVGEGEAFVRLRVVASDALGQPAVFDVQIVDGAARDGEDYAPGLRSELRIAAGARAADILVPIIADARAEYLEDFIVRLAGPAAAALPADRRDAVVVIIDDDGPPPPAENRVELPASSGR